MRGRISYRTPQKTQKRGDKDSVNIHVVICGLCRAAQKWCARVRWKTTRDLLLQGIVDEARTAPVADRRDGCFVLVNHRSRDFHMQMTRCMCVP